MSGLNNVLLGLLVLLVIAITLFVLQHYGVFSFKVFPETWFYIDEKLSDHLNETKTPPPPTNTPTVPPVDPTPPTNDQIIPPTVTPTTPSLSPPSLSPPSLAPPSLGPASKPKYLGCFRDTVSVETTATRVFPSFVGVLNLDNCNAEAKKVGSKYFGLQYLVDNGGVLLDTAQCWIDGQNRNAYNRDGKADEASCPILGKATYARGGPSVNAVYETI